MSISLVFLNKYLLSSKDLKVIIFEYRFHSWQSMIKVDRKDTKKLVMETRQWGDWFEFTMKPAGKYLFIVNKNTRLSANQLNGVCRSGVFTVSFEHI